MDYLQAASVPCGGAKIKTLVAFSALARADLARLTPPNALPITRRDHASAGMRGSGECPERQRGRTVNPLADAFVGSSPTSPTSLRACALRLASRPIAKATRRSLGEGGLACRASRARV